jgi:Pericentrin-AKAP-450 domain of centrosomal targeting protein
LTNFWNSNKAQLRELEHIRTSLLGNRKPLPAIEGKKQRGDGRKPTLKTFLVMARFIARMRIAANGWAEQEKVRQRLIEATEEMRRAKRAKQFRVVRVEEVS